MSNQPAQRVRRNGSPSTSKQGPIKAVKAFSLKYNQSATSSSHTHTSPSSPSPRDSHPKLCWSRRSPPERHFSPERKSPGSVSPKEKNKSHRHSPVPGKWRASSVDTVVPSYLTGQWPKDINSYHHYQSSGVFMCDKATQTVEQWDCKIEKKKKSHRRSASFGQGDQLKLQFFKQHLQKSKEGSKQLENGKQRSSPVPANHSALSLTAPPTVFAQQGKSTLTSTTHPPRQNLNRFQRNGVEGLNLEIEKLVASTKNVTIKTSEAEDTEVLKDIPDGHRAPVPEVTRLSCTRSVDTQTPSGQLEPTTVITIVNRPTSLSPSAGSTLPRPGSNENSQMSGSRSESADSKSSKGMKSHSASTGKMGSLPISGSSLPGDVETSPEPTSNMYSPKLNKSCPFVREPPDGCEKVTVVEESRHPQIKEPMLFSPVKPNQFEFKQSQCSAFCPLTKAYFLESEFPINHQTSMSASLSAANIES